MPVTALIGLQWGDEGKGKVVDVICDKMDVVVRAQGGANAGHTVIVAGRKHVLHLIPSGMLLPRVRGVIGNGVVLDPFQLVKELDTLGAAGYAIEDRLTISNRAHLVLPWHAALDAAFERHRGGSPIGTTGRGIGPAYMDKACREGIRVEELRHWDRLLLRLREQADRKNHLLAAFSSEPVAIEALIERLASVRERLLPMIADTVWSLNEDHMQGRQILIEGAQGSLLDVDLGTYPYVTSSQCHLGGLLAGSGMPPQSVTRVVGVCKAYTTRVGSGPFPTEERGDIGAAIRAKGQEFGATTGRPRRCGWLDLLALRYATTLNGVTEIALTKSDVLAGQGPIHVATTYEIDGRELKAFPSGSDLDVAVPRYRAFPGFDEDISACATVEELPGALRDYVSFIESALKIPIAMVSTGPGRHQTIRL
jgi:adenylosuccinate synthase